MVVGIVFSKRHQSHVGNNKLPNVIFVGNILCCPNGFRFESPCIYLYLKVMRISSEGEQNEINSIGATCD